MLFWMVGGAKDGVRSMTTKVDISRNAGALMKRFGCG
jgi:hypothetical protein